MSRANVHNISIMEELELGVGDEIEVYKANMIIPRFSAESDREKWCERYVREVCPGLWRQDRIARSAIKALYCTNPDCQAKHVKAFALFASRAALNIEKDCQSKRWRVY